MLDIRRASTFADYFVICNGTTERQMRAICEEIDRALTHEGAALLHREGTIESGWVLLDFGDVIVHVFTPLEREYYHLERLWGSATPVVKIQ